eukprot:TRINITY_DN13827_c1_g1_i1.p1 TRINITY_DN13827_c1_g1~~TRINITY_DN13827_c1_g1_i1.p1  ORF type:complete len:128 (+),score=6.14 TRINITY_DN13827_c1_g1_i1:817-1200(+)
MLFVKLIVIFSKNYIYIYLYIYYLVRLSAQCKLLWDLPHLAGGLPSNVNCPHYASFYGSPCLKSTPPLSQHTPNPTSKLDSNQFYIHHEIGSPFEGDQVCISQHDQLFFASGTQNHSPSLASSKLVP